MMKFLPNSLMMFAIAIMLVVSPVQSIVASVSDCVDLQQGSAHSMKVSDHGMQQHHVQQVKSDNQHDCCETTACDMTHCASFVAIAITVDTQSDIIYTLSEVNAKPSESLIPFYPSSLYRPPKA